MIGLDGNTGMERLTFGSLHLLEALDFLVAIVGLFAVTEVFVFIVPAGTDPARIGGLSAAWR